MLILTDDQRYDTLSCTNNPYLKTPHLDRLAREGALLTQSLVTTSLCCPSRATILTGKYAHRTKVTDNEPSHNFQEQHQIFPQHLQAAGYDTAFVGKWHLPNDRADPVPGFNTWVSFKRQGNYEEQLLNVNGQFVRSKKYLTDSLTEHALAFLQEDREQPFCLIVATKNCHQPFTPAPRHRGSLDVQEVKLPGPRSARDQDSTPEAYQLYLESVLSVDDLVGQILATLEEKGSLDNTAIFFTSDNGYMFGEHGKSDKSMNFDLSLRVPTLVRYPVEIEAGQVIHETVLNTDFAATFLDLAGVDVPENLDGASFRPLWRKGEDAKSNWRSLSVHYSPVKRRKVPRSIAVRTSTRKLILYRNDLSRQDMLFDLLNDPGESRNLVSYPQHRKEFESLKMQLSDQITHLELDPAWREPFGLQPP